MTHFAPPPPLLPPLQIAGAIEAAGYASDNVSYGMGGGLLQKVCTLHRAACQVCTLLLARAVYCMHANSCPACIPCNQAVAETHSLHNTYLNKLHCEQHCVSEVSCQALQRFQKLC